MKMNDCLQFDSLLCERCKVKQNVSQKSFQHNNQSSHLLGEMIKCIKHNITIYSMYIYIIFYSPTSLSFKLCILKEAQYQGKRRENHLNLKNTA